MSKLIVLYKYICKCLMKIKSCIKCNDQLGYWDKLYDKYYEEYKSLSIKELRRLQSIKFVNYNVNLSYPWTTIFISAVLGAVVSNIINVFKFLSSDMPINLDQSIVNNMAWGVILAVILVPLVGYIYLYVKKIYFFKTVLDIRKQKIEIECAVIKNLLLEREDNKKNRT